MKWLQLLKEAGIAIAHMGCVSLEKRKAET